MINEKNSENERKKYLNLLKGLYDARKIFDEVSETVEREALWLDKKIADPILDKIDSIVKILMENSDLEEDYDLDRNSITAMMLYAVLLGETPKDVFMKKYRVLEHFLQAAVLTGKLPERDYIMTYTDEKLEVMHVSIDTLVDDVIFALVHLKEFVKMLVNEIQPYFQKSSPYSETDSDEMKVAKLIKMMMDEEEDEDEV